MKIETEVYKLPAYWASALVNNDFSGMTEEEVNNLQAWYDRTQPGSCAGIYDKETDVPFFSWGNDANSLGGDVLYFEFYKPSIENTL